MSDEADKAQDREELEDQIRRKYTRKPELEVPPTGYCLNCGEPVKYDMRWCDVFCRNDWAGRQGR